MWSADASDSPMPEGTYVELVRSVFSTLAPTTIMGILYTVVASWAARRSPDTALSALAAIGIALSIARVGLLLRFERRGQRACADRKTAAGAERAFAAAYLAFALTLGLFGARVLQLPDAEAHTLAVALLIGYGAGVAAGVSLRPWIALPAIAIATVPAVVVALSHADPSERLLGFVIGAFLLGGLGSMVSRFRSETEKITMRHMFGALARRDALTGLENRLGLAERHAVATAGRPDCLQAVHCLDLDRFKAVNDQHGHPVGDALLVAVAGRLSSMIREGDVAARLGGDEFAVLQPGLRHRGEAELLARRIARALAEPYAIGDLVVRVGVSVGYAVSDSCDDALEDLLATADGSSYRAKRRGGGVAGPEEDAGSAALALTA